MWTGIIWKGGAIAVVCFVVFKVTTLNKERKEIGENISLPWERGVEDWAREHQVKTEDLGLAKGMTLVKGYV